VCTDYAVRENGKLKCMHLLKITAGATRDQTGRPECFISRTHDLPESGRSAGIIEVLEHNHRRPRHLRERGNLLIESRVGIVTGGSGGSECCRGSVPDHWWKFRET